jgi:hypothetical protein
MSQQARGLVWEALHAEQILVSYFDADGSDEEWRSYLALLKGLSPDRCARLLVYAETPPARRHIDGIVEVVRGKQLRVSLVSPSTAVRFVASTFALIVRGFRFFPPEQLSAALLHIGCDHGEQVKVRQVLDRLQHC